jgi:hypothetical protein
MIHTDGWTTKTKSIGGCRFYVKFIDDHTRKVWVYFMKHKGEVFQHFLNFKVMHYYILCLFAKGQMKNLKGLRNKNKKPERFAKQKQSTIFAM